MSDVGKPRPPMAGDELVRPDVGFHDDKIGSELKHAEAAKRRAFEARTDVKPRRIEQEPKKVAAAGAFHKAAREEQPHVAEAKRHQRALISGQPQPRKRGKAPEARGEAERAVARVHTLFHTMVSLEGAAAEEEAQAAEAPDPQSGKASHKKVEAVSGDRKEKRRKTESPVPEEAEPQAPKERDLAVSAAKRLARAHQQARYHVQHLVAGGTGFTLGPEPHATFAELFSRLPAWPQGVPPGHQPDSEHDFDLFFAWVFLPGEVVDLEWPEESAG